MNILNTVIQIVYSDTLHNRACCSSAWEKAPMPTSTWLHCMIILLKHDHKCTIVQTVQRRGRYRVEQKRTAFDTYQGLFDSLLKGPPSFQKTDYSRADFLKRWINRQYHNAWRPKVCGPGIVPATTKEQNVLEAKKGLLRGKSAIFYMNSSSGIS